MKDIIASIFSGRAPAKVAKMVIPLVAIDMPDHSGSERSRSDKGIDHYSRSLHAIQFPSVADVIPCVAALDLRS
jgi:hypothetical protein